MRRLLGQGSYASVYRGRVIESGEPVAVKVIDKRLFSNAFNLKNLHCEIDIMKKVRHDNIVELHDVLQTTNNMYIITELCDHDLFTHLRERKRLEEKEAVDYLRQIMEGVKYLNGKNVTHRDLKPANILLRGKECKISDFGFAKNIESESAVMKSIVGTPLYMSPQLLHKQKYTNKSDLWSIGLIFYEMLHGKTPWIANNELQLVNAIHSQKLKISKSLSPETRDFISKCLQIEEANRISWEEAFQHPLISPGQPQRSESKSPFRENRSAVVVRGREKNTEGENNSNVLNLDVGAMTNPLKGETRCITPKLRKNISEIRLKKVEALTPKSSFANINHRLKQVWAFNTMNHKRDQGERRRRNLTTTGEEIER